MNNTNDNTNDNTNTEKDTEKDSCNKHMSEKQASIIRHALYAVLIAALPIVSLFMSECVHNIFI